MRLVDADRQLLALKKGREEFKDDKLSFDMAEYLVSIAPTVQDVVLVVRCKDCIYRYINEFCSNKPDNGFCSDGNRK